MYLLTVARESWRQSQLIMGESLRLTLPSLHVVKQEEENPGRHEETELTGSSWRNSSQTTEQTLINKLVEVSSS